MKRRFLPFSLLLVTIILAQASIVANATGNIGKYTPRTSTNQTAQAYMQSIRANQETGLIDPAWLIEGQQVNLRDTDPLNWKTLGPDNFGSLTRAILYDKNDAGNLYIGTMGGSLFKSSYNGLTWELKSTVNALISCIAQSADGTIYVGTGDGHGAHNQNGLSYYNYENSFAGSGIYKLVDGDLEQIASTVPTIDNGWEFVNEITFSGDVLYAATDGGLRYSNDGGSTWAFAKDLDNTELTEEAYSVKVGSDGTVLAVVGNEVYMSNGENFTLVTNGEEGMMPAEAVAKVIAIAPSDPNYMYVSYLTTTFGTGDIYYTKDHGTTWEIALSATPIYDIYGTRGLLDNGITVYPNNPRKLLIGGVDLWLLEDATNIGVYTPRCISSSSSSYYTTLSNDMTRFIYVHGGIQSIVFNPNNESVFFVGTEGGIYKGSFYEGEYSFENGNRYFITATEHTSVARMLGVGASGEDNQVLGGCLDHGAIYINGDENVNNITTGRGIFPNQDISTNAYLTYGQNQFPLTSCVDISTIDPDIMFISDATHPLIRTESKGYDYDASNFNTNEVITNANAFKTPFVLFENYHESLPIEKVKFYARFKGYSAGDVVKIQSNNTNYPFDYTLTDTLPMGDSIIVDDIITTKFIMAIENTILMTRDALKFNKPSEWFTIDIIEGIPSAIAIDSDCDVAYVGTYDGNLYRMSNLTNAIDSASAIITDSTCVVDTLSLKNAFNGQAITSIAVDPSNANNVIVTLGNYGNDNYVYYSNNANSAAPTFTAKQGNLPKAPVYSSLIEMKTGKIIIGTEKGIYTTDNIDNPSWVADANLANIPVMELKQQLIPNHETQVVYLYDEAGDSTAYYYKGIFNEGMIYAATYGRGLYKCDNFKEGMETSVPEINAQQNTMSMMVYPNPIISNATINFNINEASSVSYEIFDLSGRLISRNVLGDYQSGEHQVTLNMSNLTSGTYLLRVQAGTNSKTSKILVF